MGKAGSVTTGRRIRGLDAGQRQARRRRQLLDAALALVAERGYANTSIEQICQTAFVGTKGFYELFDSKEACYLALLDETTSAIADRLVTALRTAPAGEEGQEEEGQEEEGIVRALTGAFAHAVADDPRIARVTFGQTGSISPAVDRHQRASRRWAATFLERTWRRYGLACAPADELRSLALAVVGGSVDLVVDWLHERDGDIDALVDALTEFHELVRAGLATRVG